MQIKKCWQRWNKKKEKIPFHVTTTLQEAWDVEEAMQGFPREVLPLQQTHLRD